MSVTGRRPTGGHARRHPRGTYRAQIRPSLRRYNTVVRRACQNRWFRCALCVRFRARASSRALRAPGAACFLRRRHGDEGVQLVGVHALDVDIRVEWRRARRARAGRVDVGCRVWCLRSKTIEVFLVWKRLLLVVIVVFDRVGCVLDLRPLRELRGLILELRKAATRAGPSSTGGDPTARLRSMRRPPCRVRGFPAHTDALPLLPTISSHAAPVAQSHLYVLGR